MLFQLPRTDDSESCGRQSRVDSGGTFVSYTGLVPPSAETSFSRQLHTAKSGQSSVLIQQKQSSSVNNYEDGGFQVIGKYLTCAGVSTETAKVIISSWRESTIKQYGSHFKRWVRFCGEQQIDVINPSVNNILNYLTMLHQGNLGYSSVNTAKSMLSSLFSLLHKRDIGKEPLIRHFMKGIFNLKPALPRYVNTWNVQVVIDYLDSLITSELNLKLLSVKLATLLALATGQRCQTLWSIRIKDVELSDKFMKIRIFDLLKQSKPN